MPLIGLNEWNPSGNLSPTPQSGSQGVMSLLTNAIGGYQKQSQDKSVRRAAAKLLGIPEDQIPLGMFKADDLVDLQKEKMKESFKPKEWKPTTMQEALDFEKAKKGGGDISKSLIGLLGGLKDPSSVFTPDQITQIAPKSAGPIVEGGSVLESPGQPGEYAPGYEPKSEPAAIADMLRQKLGVTQEETQRHALGLPQKQVKQFDPQLTQKVIGNIKTEDDFNELIKNKTSYEAAGVDIGEVVKQHLNNPILQNNSFFQKIKDYFTKK